jgi:phage baseplate assembly protein W
VTRRIAFPLAIDGRGRTAEAEPDAHILQMIEQLLFTSPGERVNRPDFGSGLLQLVFAPNSDELAAALEFSMQAALQQWLGDVIDVRTLAVTADEATLQVDLRYLVRRTGEEQSASLRRGTAA